MNIYIENKKTVVIHIGKKTKRRKKQKKDAF